MRAGAITPATPVRAGLGVRACGPLNEGRGCNPGDTARLGLILVRGSLAQ